jgi:hypothetical protein
LAILLTTWFAFSCRGGGDDDNPAPSGNGDDDNDTENGEKTFPFSISFEDYALGELPAPWEVAEHGDTTFRVVDLNVQPGASQALLMSASETSGDWGSARYPFSDNAVGAIGFTFYVYLSPGAQFEFVVGSDAAGGDGVAIHLAATAEGRLVLYDYASGTPTAVDCAALAPGVKTRLAATIFEEGYYSVAFPDDYTLPVCDATGQYPAGARLTYAQFVDASDDGARGDVWFDDFFGSRIPVD